MLLSCVILLSYFKGFLFTIIYLGLLCFIHRYLSDVELLPIIGKIHPSEHYYAKQQADYIISQVFVLNKKYFLS